MKNRRTIAYIDASEGELKGENGKPFFRARLDAAQARDLCNHLARCAEIGGRKWFMLTSTDEKPERLRLTEKLTPQYELVAGRDYLRCDPIHVTGAQSSCNIDFSGQTGATLLLDKLRAVQRRMRRFVEIRIPNRKRPLIEFVADTDMESAESAEHQRLALTGAALAAQTWSGDEFADWETHDA